MELVVFDLDGTLLNRQQSLSPFTCETLNKLQAAGIAYTIATGRTRLAAMPCIQNHDFSSVQIFKNGIEEWNPKTLSYRHRNLLSRLDIEETLAFFEAEGVTPFIFCVEEDGNQTVYHPPLQSDLCNNIFGELGRYEDLILHPLYKLHIGTSITNISAMASPQAADRIVKSTHKSVHLSAYSGGGIYQEDAFWIDIHHKDACKGTAIHSLKEELGASKIICFGDGDNDLSMFKMADEAYAMSNASDLVKAAANKVIGHHDEDGVAIFLRERFNLS
ncbi:HAD family hydrolase [Marinomonas sp. 15G1-11]|uniref:HAD family hydrolase n=1 Tax=Marinomonas phaeophyticola TaxID=3004091 RepID=A0ABT4JZ99_9GAMM|nr:HAD family hydrolase [Marinomonas sp. 15G1-11]MCZ2722834.1 HAD family hydrolase [Marinomonas sp. 15G1-11]